MTTPTSTDTKIEEILERFMYSFTHLDDPMDLRQTATALKTLLTSEKNKAVVDGEIKEAERWLTSFEVISDEGNDKTLMLHNLKQTFRDRLAELREME